MCHRVDTGKVYISIHALLAESDGKVTDGYDRSGISIHALLAESDYDTSSLMQCQAKFLSTLSLRRATAGVWRDMTLEIKISIHALLAESDTEPCAESTGPGYFYPRSPCGERQVTAGHGSHAPINFYPRSPCGERLVVVLHIIAGAISIHALLAESDPTASRR